MGSKRDGVMVPWDRHGVRPHNKVRAMVRDGRIPGSEEPRHRRKGGQRKPWRVQAIWSNPFLGDQKKWCTLARYTDLDDAQKGFATLSSPTHTVNRMVFEQFRLVGPEGVIREVSLRNTT